jgi:2',3'-cyclic-nucleotide 2'-phosphodiesterase (5'-nucleotidase family)
MSYARGLTLVLLVAGCSGGSPNNGQDGGVTRSLILLHTNDEHSHLIGFGPELDDHPAPTVAGTGAIHGGIGRRAAVLSKERMTAMTAGAATLTVSAGDNTMGTLMQALNTTAAPDFASMKKIGYDVSTLGNHEFDFGPAALATEIGVQQANGGLVPTVASNIHFSSTDTGDDTLAALFDESGTDTTKPLHRSLVVTTSNGLKVGFVGIIGADAQASAPARVPVQFSTAASGKDSDYPGVLAQLYKDLQPVVDHLRNDLKVDLVVALSHSGVDLANDSMGEDNQIAANVNGIDVIVSGHSHTLYPAKLVTNPNTNKPVLIQQAGMFGQYVGRIAVNVDASGAVSFDMANTKVITVDDTVIADPAYNMSIDTAIDALESTKLTSGMSFLEAAVGQTIGSAVTHNPQMPGDLYFYNLGKTGFDVPGLQLHKETPLLVLSADAMLAACDGLGLGTTDLAIQANGVIRADLSQGKTGNVAFGDVFRVLPLGISTADGTIGYSVTRFAVLGLELKAALEVSAGYSYTTDNAAGYYLVPAGLKYEYDTSRPIFDTSSPTDPTNGRVTKITLASNHATPDTFDKVIFDLSQSPPFINGAGATYFVVAADLYIAEFASSVGVTLRKPDLSAVNVPVNDVVVHRADGSEVKDYQALGQYIMQQSTANGGTLPSRYDPATGTFPRRAICSGPLCQ